MEKEQSSIGMLLFFIFVVLVVVVIVVLYNVLFLDPIFPIQHLPKAHLWKDLIKVQCDIVWVVILLLHDSHMILHDSHMILHDNHMTVT